ncbi:MULTISPECIES: glycoside hydrolase family 76 protein [unclassified Rathayibacter]|uniref:glycoside hydrolase family 76 protein n=1 Tax=unclassified Rathayibacter TaxID=2609250 RepID=UPI00188C0E24|nr:MULTISPECIES: glycoside hydrolase family 76 protein [unclassified Rathayibacter]MBF4463138.1 glycosyl hydrolase [Rathayibacter sp. VKM Ac-2879]MBF4504625.1 glycosyl hydrolase [Rathayibacter sp. VKM Ac-2878]
MRPTSTSSRADAAQESLERFFAAPVLGYHMSYPTSLRADLEFNYWWLAHAIDAAVDAFERTGDEAHLERARRVHRAIRLRNGGRLVNGYFDDMMWLGGALARLGEATGDGRWLDRADRLWRFAVERGWNVRHGASLAWRRRQLDYKNAPANGPFAILGARLERLRPDGREELARTAFDWMHVRLRDDASGFVADGIGREGGSERDDWAFSYNHGVYIGAALALHRLRPDPRLVAHASLTALDLLDRLAPEGVFVEQGAGDGALFGGIAYRHLVDLALDADTEPKVSGRLRAFVSGSVDTLWSTSERRGLLLAGPRWDAPPRLPATLSAELGAVLATEAAAALERCRSTSD